MDAKMESSSFLSSCRVIHEHTEDKCKLTNAVGILPKLNIDFLPLFYPMRPKLEGGGEVLGGGDETSIRLLPPLSIEGSINFKTMANAATPFRPCPFQLLGIGLCAR